MEAAHLPAVSPGETPNFKFPDKPASPADLLVTCGIYPKPSFDDVASEKIRYLVQISTTALTRDELTWDEYLHPKNFHPYGGPIPGHDVVGTVVDVRHGPQQVPKFKRRDKVWGLIMFDYNGAAAEYAIASEEELAAAPTCPAQISANAWNQELATIPLSGLTAIQALFDHGGLPISALEQHSDAIDRKHIIVLGAAGSVGVLVVQIAKAAGFHVTAVCGAKNFDFVEKQLGPDEIIDYTAADFTSIHAVMTKRSIRKADLALDCVGGKGLKDFLLNGDCIRPDGKLVSITTPLTGPWAHATDPEVLEYCKNREDIGFVYFIVSPHSEQMSLLGSLLTDRKIKGFVDAVFPLRGTKEAMEKVEARENPVRGKVVVEVSRVESQF